MYPNLKLQMWKCGIRQNRLAQLVGIHETLLSKIVNGFRVPDSELRTRIAAPLKCDEVWLFSEDTGLSSSGDSLVSRDQPSDSEEEVSNRDSQGMDNSGKPINL
jgi:transcriptional regulator with XRE-family HTH domain